MTDTADKMRRDDIAFCVAGVVVLIGLPILGIVLALYTGNPWWLWLIAPLMAFMEAGLFLIAVILMVVWSIMGV